MSYGGFLEYVASKLEKIGNFFSNFNPIPSVPSVATGNRRQETVSVHSNSLK